MTGLDELRLAGPLILAAEMGALLHDLGKLSSSFLLAKSSDHVELDHHAQCLQLYSDEIPSSLADFFRTPLDRYWPQSMPLPDYLRDVRFEHFLLLHHGTGRQNRVPPALLPFACFLQSCDRLSSAEDKSNPSDCAKQPYRATYRASPFGRETLVSPERLDIVRRALWIRMEKHLRSRGLPFNRRKLFALLAGSFRQALAETRRAANDLDLFHHAQSVAGTLKAGLVSALCGLPLAREMGQLQRRLLVVRSPGEPSPRLASGLRRFLEEKIPVSSFLFQAGVQLYFLAASLPATLRNELELEVKKRWPGVALNWQPLPESYDWATLVEDVPLTIPERSSGLLIGLPSFLRRGFCDTLLVKQVVHLEPGLDFPGLVQRTGEVLDLAREEQAMLLEKQLRSLSRHLCHLRQAHHLGKLDVSKQRELAEGTIRLRRGRYQLRRLRRGGLGKKEGSREICRQVPPDSREKLHQFVDRAFSWLHAPDPIAVARYWKASGHIPEWVALRFILCKNPSLSRFLAMLEECEAFVRSVARQVGPPVSRPAPYLACFRATPERLQRAAENTFHLRWAKVSGRLPWTLLAPGSYREQGSFRSAHRTVRDLYRRNGILEVLFSDGAHWSLPLQLGDTSEDRYYLYLFVEAEHPEKRPGLLLGKKLLLYAGDLRPGDQVQILLPRRLSASPLVCAR